jgi:predicted ribosomally synthesized peptide with SipW-like signal peptide
MKLATGKKGIATIKQLLFYVLIAGAVSMAGGSQGSFASFNATTTNPNNTFATGTLVLSDTVNAGTACLSTGGGTTNTNSNTCATAFNLAVQKPGQSGTTHLTIQNAGSIDAASFKFYSTACADANAAAETYHGTGSLCGDLEVYIQQTKSDFTTPLACIYGGGAALAGHPDTASTTCSFNATYTPTNLATTFPSAASAAALTYDGTTPGLPVANSTAYFVVGIKMPNGAAGADNSFMGRQASMDLNWYIEQ